MKKFAWASILLALVLSLSACGGKPMTPTSSLNAESAISSVAMDITDLDALTTTYLNPLCMTNVLTENWNDPSELAPHQLAFFYLSARVAKGDDENVKWSTTAFPASEVDTMIQAYFDVTPEHLHSNDEVQNYYDSKTNTYTFEAFGAPLAQKIVKADWGDNMLTLNYEFYSRADDTTVVREGKLLVKIDGNSFKYLSCSTTEKSEEITDTEARELYTQAVEEIILLHFSIYLPETWTVEDNEIFIDEEKISEIHFGILNEEGSAFDKLSAQYADAVASGAFSAGPYTGKYYHMQSEISVSGVTAKKNEIVYCLGADDKILSISFYPSFGTGIKTQREEFEAVLSGIK